MSKEKAFETILGPTLQVFNKQGEVVLSMKRKGAKYGQLYYLFEIHLDRVEPEKLKKLQLVWTLILKVVSDLNVPMFDINEVKNAVEKLKLKEGDVEIKVLDHATNTVQKLTIGVYKEGEKK